MIYGLFYAFDKQLRAREPMPGISATDGEVLSMKLRVLDQVELSHTKPKRK